MKNIILPLKIAAVFIGTVVGAGLASGQEIIQFFTIYGLRGIFGIMICGILYIITGLITVELSCRYKASSYKDLIYLSCGRYLGAIIDMLTTFFLFGGACILLSGSGAVLYEFFGIPQYMGVIIMASASILTVFYSTDGLMFINSLIVPSMIAIIMVISILSFKDKASEALGISHAIINAPKLKSDWITSSLLYTSFNMLLSTGVLSPIANDIKKPREIFSGVILGAVGLILLTGMINLVLLLNVPNVFRVSIPLLYVAKNFGEPISFCLSLAIWCEMFSTEVSDIYSLSKNIHHTLGTGCKFSAVLIVLLALPFAKIGFENLIKLLYPPFGAISLIYLICLIRLYFKSKGF